MTFIYFYITIIDTRQDAYTEHIVTQFPVVVNIHNTRVSTYKTCPWCNSTNLDYPVYRDYYTGSGLITPQGNVNDSGVIQPLGILRPSMKNEANPSGYARYAPSGLTHTFVNMKVEGTETVHHYEEVAIYMPYWTCNTCQKFFVYPEVATGSIVASGWGIGTAYTPSGSQFV